MFLVSSGFSLVKSGDLVCGSDSPVREELSTCRAGKAGGVPRALASRSGAVPWAPPPRGRHPPCSRWQI